MWGFGLCIEATLKLFKFISFDALFPLVPDNAPLERPGRGIKEGATRSRTGPIYESLTSTKGPIDSKVSGTKFPY